MRGSTRGSGFLPGFVAILSALALGACGTPDRIPVFPAEDTPPHFQCLFPISQIFDGGVGRDEIPALDFPASVAADAAGFMRDSLRVIGIEVNGAARAYPLFVLWWHEIVNDTLGGRPALVSYSPLTGSGLAFDPVVHGASRRFGVTGLLFENTLIMFDRDTESFWIQLHLGAQCGPERGTPLFTLPALETTWGHWKALHPTTSVMTTSTGFTRPYGRYPYGDYPRPDNAFTLVPSSPWNPARLPKEPTLGVRVGQFSAAYPHLLLEELGPMAAVNDYIGPLPVLVTWVGAARTARAFSRRVGGRELTFDVLDAVLATVRDRETGTTWNAGGEAVAGPLQGERLTAIVNSWTMFWFAWSVYYPGTRLFAP